MNGMRLLAAALAVALLQIGFLSWMIAGRAAILRDGREVLLKVEPVDPRDLFRGDYVQLGYDISTVPMALVTNRPDGEWLDGPAVVHVRLAPGDDGFWQVHSATIGAPDGAPVEGQVDLRGVVDDGQSLAPEANLRVTYGIERFYVPEGEGKPIEEGIRDRTFAIRAAVAEDGTAQIKALLDGDTPLYEEPLY